MILALRRLRQNCHELASLGCIAVSCQLGYRETLFHTFKKNYNYIIFLFLPHAHIHVPSQIHGVFFFDYCYIYMHVYMYVYMCIFLNT